MNHIEKHIYHIFKNANITSYDQLSIEGLAMAFDVKVVFWEFTSTYGIFKNVNKVFIDESLSDQGQWQDFGHEMKHYLDDEANQLHLPDTYKNYQEYKAEYFMYHFCVPSFMLRDLKGVTVHEVMMLFNVEFDFALRRLEMYKNDLLLKR